MSIGVGVVVQFALLLGTLGQVASALEHGPEPAAVRDYDTYPFAYVPAGCHYQGQWAIEGETFEVNGVVSTDMRTMPIELGDEVIMRWDSFAPGCEDAGIGLSVKINNEPYFDPEGDQYGVNGVYCSPDTTPCTAPYELRLIADPGEGVTCYQLDAHIGPQLARVGPKGSYYQYGRDDFNMLISAHNGGTQPCAAPPCTWDETIPESSIDCQYPEFPVTTTTTAPPPTATAVPPVTTTAAPAPSTTAPPPTSTTASPVGVLGTEVPLSPPTTVLPAQLPATGRGSGTGALLAALTLIEGGVVLLLIALRPAARAAPGERERTPIARPAGER
ncbi:MAG: hypothetical protein OEY23_16555 [Acidimicrobiia bacterium]|nr:hypothetical protein [Acidimicrobiia bacterium]MDH4349016.1 hypothetical protein [Gemmatimonadota bacterium]